MASGTWSSSFGPTKGFTGSGADDQTDVLVQARDYLNGLITERQQPQDPRTERPIESPGRSGAVGGTAEKEAEKKAPKAAQSKDDVPF